MDLPFDGKTALAFTIQLLINAGLQVARTFELDSACASFTNKVCPHSGEAPCGCQVFVLLVLNGISTPVSLVLHSCKDITEVFLDGGGDQPECQDIYIRIIEVLTV
jgi:hypothetical protein